MRPGRIEKTLNRNLMDLDAHLYFLYEDYAAVYGGDSAYIKRIANTLRNLICVSDKTEGLLWRVSEALGADDNVEIHAVGGFNKEHWLADRLDFTYIPFWRPGKSNVPFELVKISLRKFVMEGEAIYTSKKSFTHENLIKFISQQMGSSHEAEGVDPVLVRLSGLSFSNSSILVEFVMAHADLALEVGEKVLEFAKLKTGFSRKGRPKIVIPPRSIEPFSFFEKEHFHSSTDTAGDFTWYVVVRAPHLGWETNGRAHNFGMSTFGGMVCSVEKPKDSCLEVKLYTPNKVMIKRASINSIENLDVYIFIIQEDGKKKITFGHSMPHPSTFVEK